MTARPLLLSEARLAADYLARAEAWLDQAAPELRADIARIRIQLADSKLEGVPRDLRRETTSQRLVSLGEADRRLQGAVLAPTLDLPARRGFDRRPS